MLVSFIFLSQSFVTQETGAVYTPLIASKKNMVLHKVKAGEERKKRQHMLNFKFSDKNLRTHMSSLSTRSPHVFTFN